MKRVANRYIKAVSRDGRLHDRTCERRRTQNETTKTFWLHSFDVDGRDGARDSLPVSRGREPLTSTTMMPIRILSRISSIDASIKKKKKRRKIRKELRSLSTDEHWNLLSQTPRVICLLIFDRRGGYSSDIDIGFHFSTNRFRKEINLKIIVYLVHRLL